jgi:hypothetical protein
MVLFINRRGAEGTEKELEIGEFIDECINAGKSLNYRDRDRQSKGSVIFSLSQHDSDRIVDRY